MVLDEAVLAPADRHARDHARRVGSCGRRDPAPGDIVVQVVPSSKGANAGIGGAFDIAGADNMPDMLRMDGVEDQMTENPQRLVHKHQVAFNLVRGDALSRDASRETPILKAAEQWKAT